MQSVPTSRQKGGQARASNLRASRRRSNEGISKNSPARPGESTGLGVRLYKQVQVAEARLRQAEQETSPSPTSPPECAKQHEAPASRGEAALPAAEMAEADERQAQLRAIASDLLYWKGGLKVLRQAQLPKWRGSFKWQIEAKIEALQTAYAKLRAEAAKPDG